MKRQIELQKIKAFIIKVQKKVKKKYQIKKKKIKLMMI